MIFFDTIGFKHSINARKLFFSLNCDLSLNNVLCSNIFGFRNLGPPPLGKVNAAEGEKIATDSRDTKGKENANFPEYPKQKHDQSYAEETYHDAQETTPEAANLQESVAPSSSVHSIKVERSYIDLEEHRRLSKKESGSKEVNYTAQNIKREPVSDQEFVFSQHDSNKSTEKEQISKTSHETTTQNGHATNISDVKNKTEEQAGSSSEKTYAAAIKTGVTCTSERDNRVLKVCMLSSVLLYTTQYICPKYREIQTALYFFCVHQCPGSVDNECE